MTLSQNCCLLLLLAVLAGSFLGAVYSAKHGCLGNDILLFKKIPVDPDSTVLTLYVNGNNYTQIGMWTIQKGVQNSELLNGYRDRIGLDQYGNILILDLQETDEGNYTIKSTTGNFTRKDNVELNVFVAPDERCKPKIITGEDTLITYLDPDGCGKPAATAYWLEQPGMLIDINKIKLTPGQDVGTVHACIDSPALRCVKNAKPTDYCTVYKDESRILQTQVSKVTTVTLVLVALICLAIIVGIPILCIKCRRSQHPDMLTKHALMKTTQEASSLLLDDNLCGGESKSKESGVDTQSLDTNATL